MRGKGYRIELCSSDLNISSLYGLIKTRRLHSECRLRLDRIVWKHLDAAHVVLLRVTGIVNPRSTFLPTFVVITSKFK